MPRADSHGGRRAIHVTVAACALMLLACSSATDAPPRSLTDAERVAWLAQHVSAVRTVDAADPDLDDLEPLRDIVRDARIVMLGEQTHGDGTTFQAKVRLIRFLHERMGFDVLAFEAGFFDVREAWRDILAGADHRLAVSNAIFEIWSQSQEVAPLFDYVDAHATGAHPLELAGIDPQFTGPIGAGMGSRFVLALEGHLSDHGSTLHHAPEWDAFAQVAEGIALQAYRGTPMSPVEHATLQAIGTALVSETAALRNANPGAEPSFWAQAADALLAQGTAWYERVASGSAGSLNYAIIRDASMARNLSWLASQHPGRRIIVWAHSGHVAASVHQISTASGGPAFAAQYQPLGQLAREAFGADLVTIGFLAGAGQYGFAGVHSGPVPPPVAIPTPPAGSWDALLLATGHDHLLFALGRNLAEEGGGWLLEQRVARPVGYLPMVASWPTVFDAFFVSASMAPATPVTR